MIKGYGRSSRRLFEARLTKRVNSLFDDFEKGNTYIVYAGVGGVDVFAPDFSRDERRQVQEAINANDISLCMDVIDKIDEVIEKAEGAIVDIDRVDSRIVELFKKFISDCKGLDLDGFELTGRDYNGHWCDVDDENLVCPVFVSSEYNKKRLDELKALRDSILDCF